MKPTKFVKCFGVCSVEATTQLNLVYGEGNFEFLQEIPKKTIDLLVVCNDFITFSTPLQTQLPLYPFEIVTTDLMNLMGSPKCAVLREKYMLNIRSFLNKIALVKVISKHHQPACPQEQEEPEDDDIDDIDETHFK
jgi:hypothetical protein